MGSGGEIIQIYQQRGVARTKSTENGNSLNQSKLVSKLNLKVLRSHKSCSA